MKYWIDQLIRNRDELTEVFNYAMGIMEQDVTGHLIFKQWEHKRSLAQNRLMWLWNHEVAKWLTENTDVDVDQDDVHDFFCNKFWPKQINPLTNETKRIQTHKFRVSEMNHHLEQIEFWAGLKQIPISRPYEYDFVHGS